MTEQEIVTLGESCDFFDRELSFIVPLVGLSRRFLNLKVLSEGIHVSVQVFLC